MDEKQASNQPDWLHGRPPAGMPEFAVRDYIYCLDLNFNVESQLEAIRALLTRNDQARKTRDDEVQRSDEESRALDGAWNDYAVARHIDLLHASVYHDAAHSMAAVGMLAPLLETIFEQCFRGIGRHFFPAAAPNGVHERWTAVHTIQWDCHKVISRGQVSKDLVRGIKQIGEAIGLWASFPADLEKTLDALFGYRNKMFHCGFEWPKDEREKFQNRISSSGWPESWFESATSGGIPWVFYMSDGFIEHCLDTIVRTLEAFGRFIRDRLKAPPAS